MQKTQNADIQRVMNLVELYRTKVGDESEIAKAAKAEYDYWMQKSDPESKTGCESDENHCNSSHVEKWTKHLMFNEQLLGHFYSVVAGENAEKDILDQLLPDLYDTNVFTKEEESFLMNHFREMVNYIFLTPKNVSLEWVNQSDDKDIYTIPNEVLELIKMRVRIPEGSVIYNPFAGLGQLACLFPDCKLYCEIGATALEELELADYSEEPLLRGWLWAWLKVAIYANSINVKITSGEIPSYYDAMVIYLPMISKDKIEYWATKILDAYKELPSGGKLVLLCPDSLLWKRADTKKDNIPSTKQAEFRKQLIIDKSLVEIIQLPPVMSPTWECDHWCLLIAEKANEEEEVTMIDARFAFEESKNVFSFSDPKVQEGEICGIPLMTLSDGKMITLSDLSNGFPYTLDMEAIKDVISNHGVQSITGLQKMSHVRISKLDEDNLLPQIYVIERPSLEQNPVNLSSLCRMATVKVRSINIDLPLNSPWITEKDLSCLFQGALDVDYVEKANCPNNPPHTEEYDFDESGKFIENDFHYLFGKGSSKGHRVAMYRACTYYDGKKDVILCKQTSDTIKFAIIQASKNPIAIDPGIDVYVPNDNVDTMSLMAILQMPIVYRQIQTYRLFGLERHYGDILVPTNKRVIGDEIKRLKLEEVSYEAQKEKFDSMKTEYINEVRMRKHDMGQYVFELINIEDLMRYYMENRDKEKDFCQQIEGLLDNFKASISELSTLLDNLSKEEEFGEPERFDLHEFLSHLEERHKTEGYAIKYECDMESIIDYNLQKKDEIDDYLLEQEEVDARAQQEIDDYLLEQQEEDARAQQEIDDYLLEQQEEDARAQQEIDDYLLEQQEEDARAQQEIDDYLLEQQEEDARVQQEIEDSLLEDEAYVFDETQTSDDESYVADETSNVDDSAYVFEENQAYDDNSYVVGDTLSNDEAYVSEESQTHDDEPYYVDEKQIVDGEPYVIDGFWGKCLSTIPSLYVAPNDIQRLVNNILDNARKHGFTDHKRGDYEVDVKLSINTETQMFQIDFRNNGNPLPDGMDKKRYGIKGEKAGATGGTGIGGSYVKKCVEHYGGNYDIFMEDGWTVIRICLPIK